MAYTTIDKPTDYFNTKLYTGNGSTQSITGVGFQPDWCLIKNRNQALNPVAIDSVRGLKYLYTNSNSAEGDYSSAFTSFDSDGFSVGATDNVNGNGNGIVAWNWLAGGTASSNSDGSLASSVSANTTAGFSIVKYTGNATNSTVGHGLGVTPQVLIVKNLDSTGGSAEHWRVQHHKVAASKVLYLNRTNAEDNNGDFQSTYPGSSTFSISSADGCNKNGEENIAYCFAEKKGYSKFGSYTGNGNADGTFVYTGFKPAWLMIKGSSNAGDDWILFDTKRDTFNVANKQLAANGGGAEITGQTYNYIDLLSNGFKLRGNDGRDNASGYSYIYITFAENPFVTSTGIPTTAR